MNIHKFTNPDGSTHVWVNLEAIVAVTSSDDKVIVITPSGTVQVDASQFEAAIKGQQQDEKDTRAVLSRLTQAIDRLTVRIPTSIRLHM